MLLSSMGALCYFYLAWEPYAICCLRSPLLINRAEPGAAVLGSTTFETPAGRPVSSFLIHKLPNSYELYAVRAFFRKFISLETKMTFLVKDLNGLFVPILPLTGIALSILPSFTCAA